MITKKKSRQNYVPLITQEHGGEKIDGKVRTMMLIIVIIIIIKWMK
jgi:hypothetical protein